MARVSDEELNRLKYEISLERLAEARGVILRKRGEELIGLCPFHDDHSPSLVINPSKNLWNCLGACQTGGTVIDWVMKAEGVSFRHAVELLRNDYSFAGVTSVVSQKVSEISTVRKLSSAVSADGDDQERIRQVLNFYTETLKQSPEALAYLAQRGIDSEDAIERFRLGYANRTLGYHIPFKNRQAGAEIRRQLERVGIYRKSGHEHFSGCLVIPVFDEDGVVQEIYGRKIKRVTRKESSSHLYLPGPHRGVWNVSALAASSEVILCESLIDALTFWCAGYRNVTAAYGINGFTEDHLEAFRFYGIERVLIAYDRDEAGEKAASSLSEKLINEEGLECFRIQFSKGMDANAYALSVKPASKSLGVVIRKAVWLGKGRAPSITSEPFIEDSDKKAAKKEKGISESSPAEDKKQQRDSIGTDRTATKEEKVFSEDDTVTQPEVTEQEEVPASQPLPGEALPPPPLVAQTERFEPVASPLPTPTPSRVRAEISAGEVTINLGDRRWRVRGLEKNMSFDQLRVNVLVSCGEAFHVDTFDLYNARHRQGYIKQAAAELNLKEGGLKKDLGKVFLKLEELQEQQIHQTLNPNRDKAAAVSDADKASALELLKSSDLLDRILADFEKCGVVGEETNKLVGYLSAVSRKLEKPLAVVIQSSSAAGKSSLMEAVLSFLPSEEQVKYSAMTGQSLFYMGETDLKHKILAIVEEEGAERAAYALKLLQSEGELTIASTGKDPSTGRLETQEYRVEGPVMIFLTTTAIEIDEELQNRCIVLTVDEGREQTRAIHRLQRESHTLDGLWARQERDDILRLHQNAQRLLRPLWVSNPYARELTFLDDRTRTRRDHEKYLTLIRSVALLHQYQRPVKSSQRGGKTKQYVEVTLEDIEIANRLSHQVLGRSLDELAPQTRRLLVLLDVMVSARCKELEMERCDYRFTRREVREYTSFGLTQTRIHLDRLVELEYVLAHHGGRGQRFVYELLFDGKPDGENHLNGLIDVEALRNKGTAQTWRGEDKTWRGHGGPKTVGWRDAKRQVFPNDSEENEPLNGKTSKNAHLDGTKITPYLPHHSDTEFPLAVKSSNA